MANLIDAFVGERMESRRKALGLRMAIVADRIGVDVFRYRKFELGRERIGAEALQELCAIFGVEPGFFFPVGEAFELLGGDRHRAP